MNRSASSDSRPLSGWVRLVRRTTAAALRLFRLRENRERIARGFALGLIVNFLPSFGFGVLISGFFARLLGGNLFAGLVGGASLTFFWPVLFYLNMRVGQLFVLSPRVIEDLDDVTDEAVSTLIWGKSFLVGSLVNCVVVGLFVYGLMFLLYKPLRPVALRWLRRRAIRMNAGRITHPPRIRRHQHGDVSSGETADQEGR